MSRNYKSRRYIVENLNLEKIASDVSGIIVQNQKTDFSVYLKNREFF